MAQTSCDQCAAAGNAERRRRCRSEGMTDAESCVQCRAVQLRRAVRAACAVCVSVLGQQQWADGCASVGRGTAGPGPLEART
jgi:hypothetical protein